ncbi:hypothetical protein BSKO_11782 [Bryopsis sp. KO-2023]|nr:hypothetical protein BSKO_11782 [Bryopsis sp. KO-2023]
MLAGRTMKSHSPVTTANSTAAGPFSSLNPRDRFCSSSPVPFQKSRRASSMKHPKAIPQPLLEMASVDPGLTQTILLGGLVVGSISYAVVNGLKKDPEICTRCGGSGGAKCFGCEGTGVMDVPRDLIYDNKLDFVSKSNDARRCRACKGAGMVFCRNCRGSGYINM